MLVYGSDLVECIQVWVPHIRQRMMGVGRTDHFRSETDAEDVDWTPPHITLTVSFLIYTYIYSYIYIDWKKQDINDSTMFWCVCVL